MFIAISSYWELCYDEIFKKIIFLQTAAMGSHPKMTPVVWAMPWESYKEESESAFGAGTFMKNGLAEQVDMTWDKTDYLWYLTE